MAILVHMLGREFKNVYARFIRFLVVVAHLERCLGCRKVRLELPYISVDSRPQLAFFEADVVGEYRVERYLAQRLHMLLAVLGVFFDTAFATSNTHCQGSIARVVQLGEGLVRAVVDLEDLADAN